MLKTAKSSKPLLMEKSQKRDDPSKVNTVPLNQSAGLTSKPLDDQAFELIFNQHWEKIWEICFRMVGDPDDAEDITLEAFIKLYQQASRLKIQETAKETNSSIDNLGGWLYRVATRIGLNTIRSRRRHRFYESKAGQDRMEKPYSEDPAENFENNQEKVRIQMVLSKLKTRSTQILILRSTGFSYAEIAEIIKVKPGSVGTLLARAQNEFVENWEKIDPSEKEEKNAY